MLQGMLMTCFLLGYGFSALLLTPVIESKLNYRGDVKQRSDMGAGLRHLFRCWARWAINAGAHRIPADREKVPLFR